MTKVTDFGQGVKRVTSLLSVLGKGSRSGMRLKEVAAQADLSKATTHRLLTYLCESGFVEQDKTTGHFFLGFDMFALGVAAANRYGLADVARPHVLRLAQKTGDTAFLSARSGYDSVCIDFREGAYPIKVTLGIGDRRPLGIGAAALVLLASMTDAEVAEALDANSEKLANFPRLSVEKLQTLIATTRRQGYGVFDGHVVPELCSVAMPVRSATGEVVAAIGVGSVRTRMLPKRRPELLGWMQSEVEALEGELSWLTSGLSDVGIERLTRPQTDDSNVSTIENTDVDVRRRSSKKQSTRSRKSRRTAHSSP